MTNTNKHFPEFGISKYSGGKSTIYSLNKEDIMDSTGSEGLKEYFQIGVNNFQFGGVTSSEGTPCK